MESEPTPEVDQSAPAPPAAPAGLPSPRSIIIFWAIGMVLVGVVTWRIPGPTQLDDPDLAHQQGGWPVAPGSWLSGTRNADAVAPEGIPEGLLGQERFVLTFSREAPSIEEVATYREGLGAEIPVVAVVNGEVEASTAEGITMVSDPDGAIVDGIGMRRPVDGGYPAGIAIINSEGAAEYVTIDPGWTTNSFECRLVLTEVS